MENIDIGFDGVERTNPWDEGDYRVHGYAVPDVGGGFVPAYLIERVRGIPDAPKIAAEKHEVRNALCATETLACVMGIWHGVHRIRSGAELLF